MRGWDCNATFVQPNAAKTILPADTTHPRNIPYQIIIFKYLNINAELNGFGLIEKGVW